MKLASTVVDKLCRQHQYFSDIMNKKAKYRKACKKPFLEIKCKEKACHCSLKKKKALPSDAKTKKRPLEFFKKARGKERLGDKDVLSAIGQDTLQRIVQRNQKRSSS